MVISLVQLNLLKIDKIIVYWNCFIKIDDKMSEFSPFELSPFSSLAPEFSPCEIFRKFCFRFFVARQKKKKKKIKKIHKG